MKILIVSETSTPYSTGGGEQRYHLLSCNLAERGHDVTWLTMKQLDSPPFQERDGVRHLHRGPRLSRPPRRALLQMIWFMGSVFAHLLRNRYDVVDCQTYAPLPAVWLACRITQTRLVATIHDTSASNRGDLNKDQWNSARDRLLARLVEGFIYRLPYDRILTVSKAVEGDLIEHFGVPAGRIMPVLNAIDIAAIGNIPPCTETFDLIFVGRMVAQKHPLTMLNLIAALNSQRNRKAAPRLRLLMVGPGPLLDPAREQAARLGVSQDVEFAGELSHRETISRIKASTLLVLPSAREGFGLVIAEALACGTAVAGYNLPPLQEVLGDLAQESLVPVGDEEALIRRVSELLDEAARGERHRITRGKRRAENLFGVERFSTEVLNVYRSAGREA